MKTYGINIKEIRGDRTFCSALVELVEISIVSDRIFIVYQKFISLHIYLSAVKPGPSCVERQLTRYCVI
jgi:hypothetical protein